MKYLLHKMVLGLLLIVMVLPSMAQVETNVNALKKIAREQEKEWKQKNQRVEAYVRANNVEARQEFADGTIIELVDVVDGQPVYYKTDNAGAAITTRANQLWQGGSVGVVIEGEGYNKVGIWDGGAVRKTHQEFNNTGTQRVTQPDNVTSQSAHSTHVAGTIVAGGVNANAKGMAHKGQLKAYDWNSVETEMSAAATAGMEISNHSWGQIRGWNQDETTGAWTWNGSTSVSPTEDYLFGFYNSQARTWDQIAYNAPFFLITKSAGNDRGDGPSNAGQNGEPEKDGGLDGYDCIGGSGNSKNILTVGAVNEVLNYTGPSNVVMSSFSGWGPTDDGRIKPDVVGKGVNVYSLNSTNNTAYTTMSGTSMSSPNVVGSMVLLQQLYQQTHGGTPMRASTLKGLVIHTADEAGPNPGPDYKFGWGLMNTARAAEIIIEDQVQTVIDEITLANTQTYTRDLEIDGAESLRVTISWTDKQGNVQASALNNRTPSIVHDLDLRLVDESLNVYYPYKLDPDNPTAAATTNSKNTVDNVEQIYIAAPAAGTYTLIVDHAGSLTADQVFSLIISGIDEFNSLPECTAGLVSPVNGGSGAYLNHKVTWQPALFATGYDVYFGTDGGGVTTPTNILNGATVTDNFFRQNLEPLTTYYLLVKPRNTFGVAECQNIYSFTTMDVISQYPYEMTVEGATTPALPEFWTSIDNGLLSWTTTSLIGYNSSKAFACYSQNGQAQALNNWLISPPFQVSAAKEYKLTYAYRCFFPTTPESLKVAWGTDADDANLSNVLFDSQTISDQNWAVNNHLIVPGVDDHIFVGWHAYTPSGMGQFIDAVKLEDWGAVGIAESPEKQISVNYSKGVLVVDVKADLGKLSLTVLNAAGQSIESVSMRNQEKFQKTLNLTPGVYVVSVKGIDFEKNTKILVN